MDSHLDFHAALKPGEDSSCSMKLEHSNGSIKRLKPGYSNKSTKLVDSQGSMKLGYSDETMKLEYVESKSKSLEKPSYHILFELPHTNTSSHESVDGPSDVIES